MKKLPVKKHLRDSVTGHSILPL